MDTFVKEICRKENMVVETLIPMQGGQLNQVFLVNGTYVIRIGEGEAAYLRLQQEAALLQSLADEICVPKVYAFGRWRDCGYQIQGFIHGQKLLTVWGSLLPEQKDSIIAELAQTLKRLHRRTSAQFGILAEGNRRYNTWLEFYEERLRSTLEELKACRVKFDPAILELVQERFARDKDVLCEGTPCLVHRDLWQGNILVEGDKITAILDFELAMYAPVDYELLLIEEFCLYPNDFAEEDHEGYRTTDFADFLILLKKHDPGMFACQNLRKRLDLYHLLYALSSYLHWRKTQSTDLKETYLVQPSAKILNFIFEHGTRMI
jgi:aminoglycoside phosphotransferase (APT) family kinase protein